MECWRTGTVLVDVAGCVVGAVVGGEEANRVVLSWGMTWMVGPGIAKQLEVGRMELMVELGWREVDKSSSTDRVARRTQAEEAMLRLGCGFPRLSSIPKKDHAKTRLALPKVMHCCFSAISSPIQVKDDGFNYIFYIYPFFSTIIIPLLSRLCHSSEHMAMSRHVKSKGSNMPRYQKRTKASFCRYMNYCALSHVSPCFAVD